MRITRPRFPDVRNSDFVTVAIYLVPDRDALVQVTPNAERAVRAERDAVPVVVIRKRGPIVTLTGSSAPSSSDEVSQSSTFEI